MRCGLDKARRSPCRTSAEPHYEGHQAGRSVGPPTPKVPSRTGGCKYTREIQQALGPRASGPHSGCDPRRPQDLGRVPGAPCPRLIYTAKAIAGLSPPHDTHVSLRVRLPLPESTWWRQNSSQQLCFPRPLGCEVRGEGSRSAKPADPEVRTPQALRWWGHQE